MIVGPTAVGKTALILKWPSAFGGEVVSGDSQQVYRGLDIGTAKASPEEQASVPHHLIDVREVTESYSAFLILFQKLRRLLRIFKAVASLLLSLVGLGFYIQSLLEGYHLGGETPHEEIFGLSG